MLAGGEGGIGVFWHQRLLGLPILWRQLQDRAGVDFPWAAIVSQHGDGELIARTLQRFGGAMLRGSTGRDGAAMAARAGRVMLDRGGCIAVVVDGPRGPHGRVHPGAAHLARASGRPVVPLTFAVERGFQARSWDRLLVPLPFGRGCFHAGAPIAVPRGAPSLDAYSGEIGRALHDLNARADAAFDRPRAGVARPLGRA